MVSPHASASSATLRRQNHRWKPWWFDPLLRIWISFSKAQIIIIHEWYTRVRIKIKDDLIPVHWRYGSCNWRNSVPSGRRRSTAFSTTSCFACVRTCSSYDATRRSATSSMCWNGLRRGAPLVNFDEEECGTWMYIHESLSLDCVFPF